MLKNGQSATKCCRQNCIRCSNQEHGLSKFLNHVLVIMKLGNEYRRDIFRYDGESVFMNGSVAYRSVLGIIGLQEKQRRLTTA